MADVPDFIALGRHRDLEGRGWHIWVRRSLMALIAAVGVLALFNVFGQRPSEVTAASSAASFELRAPDRLRSGLIYEARFTISAHRELKDAVLVLDSDWIEGQTMNTIEPGPVSEGSRDGDLLFKLGHVPAGRRFVLFLQLQVNPTTLGRRKQDVVLYDGSERIASIQRTAFIFP
jgi:hypothetical protein